MKAFIYVGGSIFPNNITEHPKADDICIAADVGAINAKILGDTPDIIVGDFDSSRLENLKEEIKEIIDKEYEDGRCSVMGDDELDTMVRLCDKEFHKKLLLYAE